MQISTRQLREWEWARERERDARSVRYTQSRFASITNHRLFLLLLLLLWLLWMRSESNNRKTNFTIEMLFGIDLATTKTRSSLYIWDADLNLLSLILNIHINRDDQWKVIHLPTKPNTFDIWPGWFKPGCLVLLLFSPLELLRKSPLFDNCFGLLWTKSWALNPPTRKRLLRENLRLFLTK